MARRGILTALVREPAHRLRHRLAGGRAPAGAGGAPPGEREAGVVSVVVAATAPQEPFLGECVASLLHQDHDAVEVLVVPYGTGVGAIAAGAGRQAEADPRVRVLAPLPEADRGVARDAGAAAATGEYLTFVGAADVLPPGALRALVGSLEASGSSFARGGVAAVPGQDPVPGRGLGAGGRRLHVGAVPGVLSDLFVESTLFRRTFWTGRELAFRGEDAGADVDVVRAYLEADGFDLLAAPTYRLMRRGTGLAVGFAGRSLAGLVQWVAAQRRILALLEDADRRARDTWLAGVLDQGVLPLVADVERADDAQWRLLVAAVDELVSAGDTDLLAALPVEPRLRVWLLREGRRQELLELLDARRYSGGHYATRIEDGTVLAELPFLRDPAHPVPDSVYVAGAEETRLTASLRGLRWGADGELLLEVFALLARVDMSGVTPSVQVALVDARTGRRVDATAVRQFTSPEVTVFAGHRHQRYDTGGLEVGVPVPALVAGQEPGHASEWQVELRMSVAGITRVGMVDDRDVAGSAGLPAPRTVGPAIVDVRPGPDGTVAVRATAWSAQLVEGAPEPGRLSATVRLAPGVAADSVVAVRGDERRRTPLRPLADGLLAFDLDVSEDTAAPGAPGGRRDPGDRADGAGSWRLRVVTEDGRVPLAWPEGNGEDHLGAGPRAVHALRRTPRGHAELAEVAGTAELLAVEAVAGEALLTVRWLGTPEPDATLVLGGRRDRTASAEPVPGTAEATVAVPLRTDPWGLGATPLPPGRYPVQLRTAADAPARLRLGTALGNRLPVTVRTDELRVRVVHAGGDPVLVLRPPFRDDEIGAHAQHQLKTAYAEARPRLDEHAVYLQSYDGRWATDSQLALHHELRRTRPDLVLHWGVTSATTRVPEGGVRTLIYSRAYYEVLARARYLLTNMDLERWIRPKPGQRILQTFHGYPSKAMGLQLWRAKELPPSVLEAELARTSGTWDTILTPAPEMDRYYRDEYAFDGPIISHGYPRDDVLVSPEREEVRRRARRLLGIDEGRTAVLYAPTWRDDVATSHRSAHLVPHLDVQAAATALGEDYVLLMRGHRFHRISGEDAARVLDVSDYPEVNDLILAADAAVLDYSSLRFDFALTGRPMVFLVPDLDTYARGARGFLYPFEETAPGPWVATTDEVVAKLRDLDAVRREHRAAYEAFNARFNYLQDGRSAQVVADEFFGPAR